MEIIWILRLLAPSKVLTHRDFDSHSKHTCAKSFWVESIQCRVAANMQIINDSTDVLRTVPGVSILNRSV